MALFELDCGCEYEVFRAVWDYGWHDCPNGHGRQHFYRMIEPADHPAAAPLIERHLDRRRSFIQRFGAVDPADRVARR